MEDEYRLPGLAAGREIELECAARVADLAHPPDFLSLVHELAAAGTGRLGDHGQERARVVRRGERVADERERLAGVTSAGDRRPPPVACMTAQSQAARLTRGPQGPEEEYQGRERR